MKDISKDDWIILQKCIYGLEQAARQHNKNAVEILKSKTYQRLWCLHMKQSAKGKV